MAVSVAAGVPCLGRYPVRRRGPVLLYAAETHFTVEGESSDRNYSLSTLSAISRKATAPVRGGALSA